MIERKDLLLTIIDGMPEKDIDPYHSVHTIVYLVDRMLKKNYEQTTDFKFSEFTSHAGPYDKELQSFLDSLQTLGFIDNRYSPKLTERGKNYLKNTGTKRLEEALGSEEGIKWLNIYVKEFSANPKYAIEDSVLLWSKDNPHKIDEMSEFFPFLKENN